MSILARCRLRHCETDGFPQLAEKLNGHGILVCDYDFVSGSRNGLHVGQYFVGSLGHFNAALFNARPHHVASRGKVVPHRIQSFDDTRRPLVAFVGVVGLNGFRYIIRRQLFGLRLGLILRLLLVRIDLVHFELQGPG